MYDSPALFCGKNLSIFCRFLFGGVTQDISLVAPVNTGSVNLLTKGFQAEIHASVPLVQQNACYREMICGLC